MTVDQLEANPAQLDASLGDERRIFAFEADFAQDLRCIPMVVRFKLDRCGVKLSLRQWAKIGAENRVRLLALKCDAPSEVVAYRCKLVHLVETHSRDAIVSLLPDPDPAWSNVSRVASQVIDQATKVGVPPPTQVEWGRLSTLERFALLKLARSNHDNRNFLPAMREMGLSLPQANQTGI